MHSATGTEPRTLPTGSDETRRFYDEVGWQVCDGRPMDLHLFGCTENGPIRLLMHERRVARVRAALRAAGTDMCLVEVGCGGSPSTYLADLCRHITAVDFSATGLRRAGELLAAAGIPHDTVEADACDMPLPSDHFDAAFSSHMLYHLPDPNAQARAIDEILRVVRPGGVAAFVLANPFPILFPVRAGRRVLAATPFVAGVLESLRKRPPLPYWPMSIGWVRRRLARWGDVRVRVDAVPTVWFDQHVTERNPATRLLWRLAARVEGSLPRAAAYAGASFLAVVRKTGTAPAGHPVTPASPRA
jgi:SAM-dependent methyltransferase